MQLKYNFISADIPWPYNTWGTPDGVVPTSRKKARGMADVVYKVMSLDQIKALGPYIKAVTAENAALMLWTTGPHVFNTYDVAKAWGFDHYCTRVFDWVKTYDHIPIVNGEQRPASLDDIYVGMGYWVCTATECAYTFSNQKTPPHELYQELAEQGLINLESDAVPGYLFTRGKKKPSRATTGVKQVYFGPIGEHSEKPLVFHDRLETLLGPGLYLDLFSRRYRNVRPDCQWTCIGNELDGMDIAESLAELATLDLPFVPKGLKKPLTPAREVEGWQMALTPERSARQMRLFE